MLRVLVIILVIVNLVLLSLGMGWIARAPGGEPDRLARQLGADKIRIVPEDKLPPPVPAATDTTPPEEAQAGADTPAEVAPAAGTSVASAAPQAQAAPAPTPLTAKRPLSPATAPATASATPPPTPESCTVVPTLPMNVTAKADAILKGLAKVRVETREVPANPSYWVHIPPQKDRQAALDKVEELKTKGITDFFIVQEAGPNRFAISLGLYHSDKKAADYMARLKKKGIGDAQVATRSNDPRRDYILRGPADAVKAAVSKLDQSLGGLRTTACPAP